MKNLYLLLLVSFLLATTGYSQCITNGGFETGAAGINAFNYTLNANNDPNNSFFISSCEVDTNGFFSINATQIINQTNATLVQTGNDPTTGIPMVHSGNFAMKLNDNDGEAEITTMSQIFTAQSTSISFFFSLIVQNPHPDTPPQQPFFSVRIYDTSTGEIISNNNLCIIADSNNPIFTPINGVLTTDWRCGLLSIPDEYINQSIRLEFVIADCGAGAHWGNVYIDDITCGENCDHPAFGYLELEPVQYECPTEAISVCGSFIVPSESTDPLIESTLQDITLDIVQEGNILQTLTNPSITGNQFCFNVSPSDFGLNPLGGYEFNVTANFTASNGFIFTLFDSSAIAGSDVIFTGVDPNDATVTGNILQWEDVADTYEIEFVSDNTCCPGGLGDEGATYNATLNTNQIDLTLVQAALSNKCFRWRIKAGNCVSWSPWCCLASVNDPHNFPDANFGNLLEEECYPSELEKCLPTLHATFTINGFSFEQRLEWITAVNSIGEYSNTTYRAGEYIELQPGFNTVLGAVFLAEIGECTDIPTTNITTTAAKIVYQGEREDNQIPESYNGFTVYPNPTNGSISIQFETNVNEFSVYDITGKQLMAISNSNSNEISIDLSNLAPGVYLLTADGMPIQKIVKN